MFRRCFLYIFLFFGLVFFPCLQLYAQETTSSNIGALSSAEIKTIYTIRFGQGGFRDSRPPGGSLGGGEITLDIKPGTSPFALSIASEYYTNSPDPTNAYEISDLKSVNILYIKPLFNFEKTDYFLGGGIGRLKTPIDEDYHYNLQAGIHLKTFEKFGFYGVYKYLHSKKETNNVNVIDFNEHIILIGITYSFSL